jgi:competence protein ComEA
MSDTPHEPSFVDDDLPYAPVRPSWRDSLASFAESLDLTPARLAVGVVVLAVAGLVGWRLLAPAPEPAEMSLPYTSTSAPGAPGAGGAAGDGPPGDSITGSSVASADGQAGLPGVAGTAGPGAEVVVHIAGAVVRPGVQHLGAGARVVDAVERAGGATPDAELGRVNLAAPVQDGQQVYVPRVGEVPPAPVGGGPAGAGASGGSGSAGAGAAGQPGGLVNLNTATTEELDTLPGVGPATAEAIIAHREANGPFTSVDQLLDVRGIGDAKLADLRDLVTV